MVSVIIPVFNVKEYLEECVESVRSQTLSDIEVILVDDGSTDGSAELCEEYARRDCRIRVIHQENGGSTRARNAGLMACRGEYVGFVDSDDWIEPDMYEVLLRCCVEHRADLAASVKYCSRGKSEYRELLGVPEGVYEKGSTGKALVRNLIYSEDYRFRGISPNLYDKLFRKAFLCRHQLGVNERIKYGEDDVCVYACLIHADRVVMVDRAFYHYRMREGSLCRSHDDRYFERITWFYQQMKETFLQHEESSLLMEQLNRYMLEFVLRGINRQFGFGYGVVIPFYLPPYERLRAEKRERVVLYGAGHVGRDYFQALKRWGSVQVAAWVDKQYEDYQREGLFVESVGRVQEVGYDAVLIAVEKRALAEKICRELLDLGVEKEKILYEEPRTLIQDVGKADKRMG